MDSRKAKVGNSKLQRKNQKQTNEMETKTIASLQSMIATSHITDEEIIAYVQYYHEIINRVQFLDEEMNTILHWTTKANRLALCTFLLHNKKSNYYGTSVELTNIDPLVANIRGKTALHVAAQNGFTRLVVLLISSAPALLSMVDHSGHTPFYYAVSAKKFALAKVMANQFGCSWMEHCHRDGNSLIQSAILQGDYEWFEFLLQEVGPSILLESNHEGMNAFLTSACVRPKKTSDGIQYICAYLMKYHLKAMMQSMDLFQRNVLHFACLESNHVFLELFAEYISMSEKAKKKSLFTLSSRKKHAFETLCFQCDTVFHQCPLSIVISRGDVFSFEIMLPHIRNWNDERFAPCFTTIVSTQTNKVSLIAQYALNQILFATSNPSSAPLSNLVDIAKLMIQGGAKMNLAEFHIDL